jgi:hypothetical protein
MGKLIEAVRNELRKQGYTFTVAERERHNAATLPQTSNEQTVPSSVEATTLNPDLFGKRAIVLTDK